MRNVGTVYAHRSRSAGINETKNSLVRDLLFGVVADEIGYAERARMLGIDVARQNALLLVDAKTYILGDDFSRLGAEYSPGAIRERVLRLTTVIEEQLRPNSEALCAYIGNGEIAIVGDFSKGDVVRNKGIAYKSTIPVHLVISRNYAGANGLAYSYQEAHFALSLVPASDNGGCVHSLTSLALSTFLGPADNTIKAKLARLILAPVSAEPQLLDTLTTFFKEDCSYSRSARQLVIHRNTLSYRLDTISELTGLNPRKYSEAIQLGMALHFHSASSTVDMG
jgi:carbohydrate diacid regulator